MLILFAAIAYRTNPIPEILATLQTVRASHKLQDPGNGKLINIEFDEGGKGASKQTRFTLRSQHDNLGDF